MDVEFCLLELKRENFTLLTSDRTQSRIRGGLSWISEKDFSQTPQGSCHSTKLSSDRVQEVFRQHLGTWCDSWSWTQ